MPRMFATVDEARSVQRLFRPELCEVALSQFLLQSP